MSTITETATFPPGRCLVSGRSEGPFIDTGSDFFGSGRVYLSTLVVADLAEEHLNLVDGGTVKTLIEDLRVAEEKVEELEAFKEAVSVVFKKLDRKPPRKRAKKADETPAEPLPAPPEEPSAVTVSDVVEPVEEIPTPAEPPVEVESGADADPTPAGPTGSPDPSSSPEDSK